MKKGIHPDYHFVNVVLNDGTSYRTRTTWGEPDAKLTLDIDPLGEVTVEETKLGPTSLAARKAFSSKVVGAWLAGESPEERAIRAGAFGAAPLVIDAPVVI